MMSNVSATVFPTQGDDAFKPLLGAGARYNIDENLSLQATYTHYFGDNNLSSGNNTVPVINNFLVGVHYTFE